MNLKIFYVMIICIFVLNPSYEYIQDTTIKNTNTDTISNDLTNRINELKKELTLLKNKEDSIFKEYVFPILLIFIGYIIGNFKEKLIEKKKEKENERRKVIDNIIICDHIFNSFVLYYNKFKKLYVIEYGEQLTFEKIINTFDTISKKLENITDQKEEIIRSNDYMALTKYFKETNKNNIEKYLSILIANYNSIINKSDKTIKSKEIRIVISEFKNHFNLT